MDTQREALEFAKKYSDWCYFVIHRSPDGFKFLFSKVEGWENHWVCEQDVPSLVAELFEGGKEYDQALREWAYYRIFFVEDINSADDFVIMSVPDERYWSVVRWNRIHMK